MVDDDWKLHRSGLLQEWPGRFDLQDPSKTIASEFSTPALQFAIEQALVGLESRRSGRPIPDVIAPGGPLKIRLAGLVTGSGAGAVESALHLAREGYTSMKIKVGRSALADDITTILDIRRAVGPNVNLRFDANRAWSLEEAVRLVDETAAVAPEFIEEPLAEPEQMERLVRMSGAPVGLDETILTISPNDLEAWSFATHVVLKPTLIGGMRVSDEFARAARKAGMTPVVSGAYESGLGTSMLVCLAARLCPDGPPAGLDTYRRLDSDLLAQRLPIGPETYLSALSFEPKADFNVRS
jgi:O-succinylbenzoate synthase